MNSWFLLLIRTVLLQAHADPNRFAMGFAAESLRRLAAPRLLSSAVEALDTFVVSP